MAKPCHVVANGERFAANPGDVLLDAAQVNGVDVPYDCRSGRCGSCVVRLLAGRTIGGDGASPGTIHACQARILGDLTIAFDEAPAARTWTGRVAAIENLTWDVTEVTVVPSRPVTYLPGQYFRTRFASFPERAYSPTIPLDAAHDGTVRFHIRRFAQGAVSSQLGKDIQPGHAIKLRGPHGSAHFRRESPNRLVLVSGGTGFAPIWSIADAALTESATRPVAVVVGVRSLDSLYMGPALELLAACRNVSVLIAAEQADTATDVVRLGRPSDHLPDLTAHDIVYAAGPAGLVEAVRAAAVQANAAFHADPFLPGEPARTGWVEQLIPKLRRPEAMARARLDPLSGQPAA